jgi:hypothetical protein
MSRLVRWFALGAVAWLASAGLLFADDASGSAHKHKDGAKECAVDKFLYKNKGGYTVDSLDLWFVKNGKKHLFPGQNFPEKLGKDITAGQSFTVNINDLEGKMPGAGVPTLVLEDGMEVWPMVNIKNGDRKSCHKDGHKLIYRKDVGSTITFESKGTTLNNNSCDYAKAISKQCDDASFHESE